MIPTDAAMPRPTPESRPLSEAGARSPRTRFVGLRAKFVIFFSLILVFTCSTLSWYLVEKRHAAMVENLHQLGSVLLTSVVRNEHFRFGGLVAEDRTVLRDFIESLIAIDDVVYVVVTGSNGEILARQSKGSRQSSDNQARLLDYQLYPDRQLIAALWSSPVAAPQVTHLSVTSDMRLVPFSHSAVRRGPVLPLTETIYDFAVPLVRLEERPTLSFPLQLEERAVFPAPRNAAPVYGMVQIGLTDANLNRALLDMIRNVLLITGLIILTGILGTHFLTVRITRPLRSLAAGAKQLASGESPLPLTPTTRDEVGELTTLFNDMTRSLKERNLAITANLDTIGRQVTQLTTLHQASAAIASTLDMAQLMETVFQLFLGNLGYTRMVLVFRHPDRQVASVAHIAGVPPDIAEAARRMTIPIREDGTVTTDLLIHGKEVLIADLEAEAHRLHQPMLELARRAGVRSFVGAPLQSHRQLLGYLAGDRGDQPCTEEDLHVLTTIAGHVAAAVDNARAYSSLAELTRHLEQRITERTEELSLANDRLKEQDRRRSLFLSVASHELRTPMTAIRSFTENMLDGVTGSLNQQQITYLGRVEHNVARLARIINQLLDWSRLDSKKEALDLQPTCIRAVTISVAGSLQTVATDKKIVLTVETADHLPLVQADPDKLEQILWNLIGNALKFTPPEGRVTVSFKTAPSGFVQTCVADTGCGIAPENLPNMFNEFSKVPSAVPSAQGAQLGLFITKTLITMHRGEIHVESAPNVGTRLYFTIPTAHGHVHAST